MVDQVIKQFGFSPEKYKIEPYGGGLINHTWKVYNEAEGYILQRINTSVFKNPELISDNIEKIGQYLRKSNPDYLFVSPIALPNLETLLKIEGDEYYRIFPFVEKSVTIAAAENEREAFEAAAQFGRFSRVLSDFPTQELAITLPDFHNLQLRATQFHQALTQAEPQRLAEAANCIEKAAKYEDITNQYLSIVANGSIPKRVVHHDTKINNVLFDKELKGLCVIDLDTVMPGYYISDIGDMMRTYLAQENEEQQDSTKVKVRPAFFEAILKGYFSEMGCVLTQNERELFAYAGKFIIYMQALRYLTDFLNKDVYYGSKYLGHNLRRAENQFALLESYLIHYDDFYEITNKQTFAQN